MDKLHGDQHYNIKDIGDHIYVMLAERERCKTCFAISGLQSIQFNSGPNSTI